MSKAQGQKIAIRFNNPLTNDFNQILDYEYQLITEAIVTASSQAGGCPPANAIDNNLTTFWQPTAVEAWIQFQYPQTRSIKKFKWYINSPYYPINFYISGSNNGTEFTVLGTFTGISTIGWQEFSFDNTETYSYYRITSTSASSTAYRIFEVQFKDKPLYIDRAFSITGKEYNMVPNGDLIDGDYKVLSVELYTAIDDKTILISLDPNKRFNNIAGGIRINYTASKGNLCSADETITDFSIVCMPTELLPNVPPNEPEHLSSIISMGLSVLEVAYTDYKLTDEVLLTNINMGLSVLEVIYIDCKSMDEVLLTNINMTVSVTEL